MKLHSKGSEGVTQTYVVPTMSGFFVDSVMVNYLTFRDGRWYSPQLDALYEEVNQDNFDSVDAYEFMTKLFKLHGMKEMLISMILLQELNCSNPSSNIRKYTKDYHGYHEYEANEVKDWDFMAFISLINILVEDNKNRYTGKKEDRSRVSLRVSNLRSAHEFLESRVGYWVSKTGWKDFLKQLWIVFGDIRRYDPVYTEDKKRPSIKVNLGY